MCLSGKKVYFPVESLVGLGHFNRTGKIVQEMIEAGMEVTVASGTFVDRERFFPGATLKEMPPHVFNGGEDRYYTLDPDGKRTLVPEFNAVAHRDARTAAHLKNIEALRPDILISEFWPFDRPQFDGEMQAILAATREETLGKKCTRLVSVRDVLNAKETAKLDDDADGKQLAHDVWAAGVINENFDAVLVHGDKRFVELCDTFKAADKIKKDVVYTGYVINDLPERAAPDIETGPVVVSCGSGASAHDMIFSFLTAWQKLIERSTTDEQAAFVTTRPVHIVCGPRFMGEYYNEVVEWAQILQRKSGNEVKVEKYRTDLTDMLATAAFSVSLAGYNTTLEVLAMVVPALFVPHYTLRDGKVNVNNEQLYRLERLQNRGMASYIPVDDAENSNHFADKIVEEFMRQTMESQKMEPKKVDYKLHFSGAENTIKAIETVLQKSPVVKR